MKLLGRNNSATLLQLKGFLRVEICHAVYLQAPEREEAEIKQGFCFFNHFN